MRSDRRKTIFLIEDNRGDIRLIQEALKSTAIDCEVVVARDGVEAMELLQQDQAILPDLILLDLNLPRKDGREVLAEIKANPTLQKATICMSIAILPNREISISYLRLFGGLRNFG